MSPEKSGHETLGRWFGRLKKPDQASTGHTFDPVGGRGLWRRIMLGQVQLSLC
jgi:hypothetical protein